MGEQLEFTVLDVGQGTGTFMVVWDDDGTPLHTVLIDLGSERARLEAGGPSSEYVVDILNSMEEPTLDAVIFSHSDTDHINLLVEVLDQFDPPDTEDPEDPILTVGFVAYGGDRSKYRKGKSKRAINMVARAVEYMEEGGEATSFTAKASDFTGSSIAPFFQRGLLKLYLVIGNAAQPDGTKKKSKTKKRKLPDSYVINTNSLVILVEYRGVQFVATGDATGTTLAQCNTVITDKVRDTYFKNVYMLSMPHHGSAATTFDVKGVDDDITPEDNLTKFVKRIPAQTITASAERVKTFRHPSARVLSYFWDDLTLKTPAYADPLLQGGRHFYTAYFLRWEFELDEDPGDPLLELVDWPRSSNWYTIQTARNVYTNLAFVAQRQAGVALPPNPATLVDEYTGSTPPSLGVAWRYTVTETTRSLDPMVNRPKLLALRARIIARTHPEHFRLPPWWDAIDLDSDDPADLPALPPPQADAAAHPRSRSGGGRPPNTGAAPHGLARARALR